ncbi:MAG: hypothetical protein AB1779_11570 [Candidatus Thermoplasmatota archaeon]
MKEKVEMDVGRLREIAKYYEFPVAVFFSKTKLKKTRRQNLKKYLEALNKIEKIIEVLESG